MVTILTVDLIPSHFALVLLNLQGQNVIQKIKLALVSIKYFFYGYISTFEARNSQVCNGMKI